MMNDNEFETKENEIYTKGKNWTTTYTTSFPTSLNLVNTYF